jgi:predicted phage-related endonuclease
MGQQELLTTVRNLKELMMMKDELEAEIEAAQDATKGELTAREVDELAVGAFKVRWTKVISNRFDTAAFKGRHADLYSQFTKATETRRFSIA